MSSLLGEEELARRTAALRERLDAPPATSWRPDKEGSGHPVELVGIFVRREKGLDRGYGEGTCAVVRTIEGAEWRVWFKTAIEQQFERLEIAEGDLVAIRYLGFVEPKDGRAGYHNYRVEVDHAPPGAGPEQPERGPPPFAGVDSAGITESQVCDQCGYADLQHAAGCPNDLDSIPF